MKQLSEDDLKTLFEAGYERRSLDFKDAFDWENKSSTWIKETVIRAVLGLTNTRGGGQILIGVAENEDKSPNLKGLSASQVESFNNFDAIKGCVDGFSSEPTDLEISSGIYQGKSYVVITVGEFEEYPTICKKNGETKELKTGDIYARAKKGHPSTIRIGELEMREIVKMAADKEKANYTTRGWQKISVETPADFYKKQLGDLA